MHTVSQRLQAYFGWCPNHISARVQTADLATGRVAPINASPEPPQPGIIPTRIATPVWMNAAALVILIATCFVGGNIWWPAIVLVILVIFVIVHLRTVKNTGGHQ